MRTFAAVFSGLKSVSAGRHAKRRPAPPHHRRLAREFLEDRRMLDLGDLLYTLDDPGVTPQADSQFGYAVATDGNLTVVGVPYADVGGLSDVGRAYVFNSTTGALVATLNNPTPTSSDYFGSSVAVSGNTVVVGA